jgi:NDP-sugar pyrophosphorylase family protein
MQAMILAAGLGTRLRPLTDDRPKAMVELNGRPLLEWTIRRLIKHGFDDLIINVHHFADQIIDFLAEQNNFGIRIQISDEREEILETGGGLKKACPFFGKAPFLLCNTDVVTDLDLNAFYQAHIASGALATLATRWRSTSRYLIFNEKQTLCGWQNTKTGEVRMSRPVTGNLQLRAFSGIHVINPRIFDLITEEGKFSIIDTYLRLAKHYEIRSYPHDNDIWIDVGRPESLREAKTIMGFKL